MAEIDETISGFIARWQGGTGYERANYQLFLTELTSVLDLPGPEPAAADHEANTYCFERQVAFRHGDGSESDGYIDLYGRGAFVLEAKDVKVPEGRRYDDAMLRARAQAEAYARALPAAEETIVRGSGRHRLCHRAVQRVQPLGCDLHAASRPLITPARSAGPSGASATTASLRP